MDEIKTTDVRWLPSQEAVVKINVDDRCMLGTGTCPGIRAFFFFCGTSGKTLLGTL